MAEQGVVTIMHVDVEGSTELTTRVGDDEARSVLSETKRIVRERVEASGGREIDAVGDAMMLTFSSPRQAIAGAIAVQNELAGRERSQPGSTLPVRIGLHVGEVLERDGTPFGAAVNAGARVMAKARGGEIFVSEMLRQLAGTTPGVAYRDRGRHAFRGFPDRWRLFEVDWQRLPPAPSPPRPRPKRQRRRLLLLVAGGLAALVVAAAVAALTTLSGGNDGLAAIARNNVGLIDPESGRIERQIPVGERPVALAAADGMLWVGNFGDDTVMRIDEDTGEATTIPVGGHPTALVTDRGGVWVLQSAEGRIVRIDAQYDRPGTTIEFDATSLAVVDGTLWVTTEDGTSIHRLDTTGRPVAEPLVLDLGARYLTTLDGTVWVSGSRAVTPVDSRTAIPGTPVELLGSIVALAAAERHVWALIRSPERDVVQKIDVAALTAAGYGEVGAGPVALALTPEHVWVANSSDRTVSRLPVDNLSPARTFAVGGLPVSIAAGRLGVWVAAT